MPHAWEQAIIEFLTNLFHMMDWAGVVVIMTLESANIPIPSEVTMPLSGWLLVEDRGGSMLQAALLGGLWGGVGCLLGSVASYALGYYGGRPLVEKYGKYIMVHPDDIDRADKWFNRWGDWTAFLSRLLPIVRTFISLPAGIFKVRFWSFSLLTFVGSALWCGALAVGGWYFGSRWEELRAIMRPFDIPIAIILVGGGLYYIYRHVTHGLRKHKSEAAEEVPPTE